MNGPDLEVAAERTAPGGASARRRWATRALVVLVVAALAVALARGWDTVARYDWQLRPGWIALGVVLVAAAYLNNGLVYGHSVTWLSRAHPPPLVALSIWSRSLLARYVPGSVMMVVTRAVLSHDHGVPRRASLAATAYEQALALGISAIGGAVYLAAYGNPGEGALLWLLAIVPVVLVVLHPVPFRRLSTWALAKLRRPPIETIFTGRQVGALLAGYVVGTVPLVLGVGALTHGALGSQAGGVFEVGLAFLLAFVISFMTFVLPSGIGVRDGILALALARHVPGEVALAVSVGLRFALTAIELVFVGVVVWVARAR